MLGPNATILTHQAKCSLGRGNECCGATNGILNELLHGGIWEAIDPRIELATVLLSDHAVELPSTYLWLFPQTGCSRFGSKLHLSEVSGSQWRDA